jgi:hypothetical protein
VPNNLRHRMRLSRIGELHVRPDHMHPAFNNIEFGPFDTAYHRAAVDEGFREALSEFLERELLPQVEEPFSRTQGRLTAEFNAEKYCGPKSAVRDAYKLEFSFLREHGADEIKAQIYRDAKTGSFRPRFIGRPLILWTEKRKAEQKCFREAIDQMVKRIQAGERSEWVCPRCSSRLSLIDSPALFDLRCKQGCFDYNFHRDPETRQFVHGHFFSKPPKRPGEGADQGGAAHRRQAISARENGTPSAAASGGLPR